MKLIGFSQHNQYSILLLGTQDRLRFHESKSYGFEEQTIMNKNLIPFTMLLEYITISECYPYTNK